MFSRYGASLHLFFGIYVVSLFEAMFFGLPDPDPLVRGPDLDPSIIKQK